VLEVHGLAVHLPGSLSTKTNSQTRQPTEGRKRMLFQHSSADDGNPEPWAVISVLVSVISFIASGFMLFFPVRLRRAVWRNAHEDCFANCRAHLQPESTPELAKQSSWQDC